MNITEINLLNWIRNIPWSTMITTRFHRGLTHDECNALLVRDVLRPIGKYQKESVAAFSVIVTNDPKHGPHAHSLVLTRRGLSIHDQATEITAHLRSQRGNIIDHENALDIKQYLRAIHPGYIFDHIRSQEAHPYTYGAKLISQQEPLT